MTVAAIAALILWPPAAPIADAMVARDPVTNVLHVTAVPVATDTVFSRWLTAYGRAWSERDPDAMVALFAADATYREDPFGSATHGRKAIRTAWVDIAIHQKDIHFAYQILSVNRNRGIAHWTASFVRRPSGEIVRLDGVLMATFNGTGVCTEFREWWGRRTRDGAKS